MAIFRVTKAKVKQQKTEEILARVSDFEKIGDYEKAFEELKEIWHDTDQMPDVSDVDVLLGAEILLHCGIIMGQLGVLRQLKDGQEHSKNMLSQALRHFLADENWEKAAECENYIALTYYRTGDYKEALVYHQYALDRNIHALSPIRLHSHIIESMVYLAERDYARVAARLEILRITFIKSNNALMQGCWAANLSLAYKNLGNFEPALKELEKARTYYYKSKHKVYQATVENNLAQIYKETGNYENALKAINRAIPLFKKLKDESRIAIAFDTKAQILIKISDYESAVEASRTSLRILENGDHSGLLSDSHLTIALAELSLKRIGNAVRSVTESINYARSGGEDSVNKVIEIFEKEWLKIYSTDLGNVLNHTDEPEISSDLKLELPFAVLPGQQFLVIRVNNDDFRSIGLAKGTMAIVLRGGVDKGDLIAISEKSDDEKSIFGYYDPFYDIVCLEDNINEPQLFNESDIVILGKIIGYSLPELNSRGKYTVKLLQH